MNNAEKFIHDELVRDGWTVYRNGWPDFAAEKDEHIRFIEVKTTDSVSTSQRQMHTVLGKLGYDVEVVRVLGSVHPEIALSKKEMMKQVQKVMRGEFRNRGRYQVALGRYENELLEKARKARADLDAVIDYLQT